MLAVLSAVEGTVQQNITSSRLAIILTGSFFIAIIFLCWRLIWTPYLEEMNHKIWRTKGLLNLIPMRVVKNNEMLKNEFISGKL